MIIRKATKEDIEELFTLYIKFLEYTNRFGRWVYKKRPKIETKEVKTYLGKRIFQKNSIFLVAEEKKKVIGFVQARIVPKKESNTNKKLIEIVDIYSKNKGKGMGKNLLKEVISWAKKEKADFLVWEMIYGNKLAEDFCVRNGFRHFKLKMMKRVR
jgi:L-amino acid N-acyltransferase YncA